MPDKKDIEYIEEDLMLKLSEAEEICQGLIETAQEYNDQEDQQIYNITEMKKRLEKIRSIQ